MDTSNAPPKQIKSVSQVRKLSKNVKIRKKSSLKRATKKKPQKTKKTPFKPTLEPVPERIPVGPLSPAPSMVEEPTDDENKMDISTPPPVTQAISLPESDTSHSSPELFISTDTEFDIAPTPVRQDKFNS